MQGNVEIEKVVEEETVIGEETTEDNTFIPTVTLDTTEDGSTLPLVNNDQSNPETYVSLEDTE